MTSQAPPPERASSAPDDATPPRHRPVTPGTPTPVTVQPHGPETTVRLRENRPPVGPPVDPYADAHTGAGPLVPEGHGLDATKDADEGESGTDVVAGDVYPAYFTPRTEQERLKQYKAEQDLEVLPKPPPGLEGTYPHDQRLPLHPTDPHRQFSSFTTSKRRRRSDWPVMVFAMTVVAIIFAGCCLAGFAIFSVWNPFGLPSR